MDMTWFWAVFVGIVLTLLALDLGVFHRKSHEVHFREALAWTGVWIGTALLFNLGVYIWMGPQPALEFLTGYLIEYSLSVDNVFVFALIFSYFAVPVAYRHRVLFWGILGALVFRAIFIAGGIALMERFHWLVYVFGAFLIVTGIRMALEKDKEIHPERNPVIRLFKRLMPVTDRYDGNRFFTVQNAKRVATPLFVALLVVEVSDLIFAVDSIPAILAITRDPFIVYTSNVFAILGLRSLYFALAGIMKLFHHLHYGLAVILSFVGVKLMLSGVFKIPTGISLGIVFGVLALSVIASLLWPPKEPSKTVA
jgi:tellurite resistance protein TerC